MANTHGSPITDPFNVWLGLDVIEQNIPFSLRAIDQWVLWRAVPKKSGTGVDKIPVQVNGRNASSTDPATWNDFQSVSIAYGESPEEYNGLGITVTQENGLVYLDFDHVRDGVTGSIARDVMEAILFLGTYAEVSPSGTGIRVIGYGTLPRPSFTTARLQCWIANRFLTITGQRVDGAADEVRAIDPDRLKGVLDWYESQDPNHTPQKITREELSNTDIREGSRNRALTALAGAMRRNGLSQKGMEAALMAENVSRCRPALSEGEVKRIARSVARYIPEADVAHGAVVAAALLDSKPVYQASESHSTSNELPQFLIDQAPGFIGELLRYGLSTAHKPLPHITLQAAFATASAAASRRYRTNRNNWPSLWFLNTEETASGKEHPESMVEMVLESAGLGKLLAGAGYTSPGAIFSTLLDRPAHIALIDEFGKLMQSTQATGHQQKADAVTLLIQAFSSCHKTLRPQAYSAMALTKDQRQSMADRRICNPGIVLYTSTTPGTFFGSINRQWVADGFLGRFITCPSFVGRQLSRAVDMTPVPDAISRWVAEVAVQQVAGEAPKFNGIDSDSDQEPLVIGMKFAPGAERMLSAVESDIHRLMDEAQRWGLEPLYGRTREKAMRLSMLVCLAESAGNRVISESQVDYALQYVMAMDTTLVEMAKTNVSDSDFSRIKNTCLEQVRKAGARGLTERELERSCAAFNALKPADQKTILGALQKSALVDFRDIQSKSGRGRKRQAWVALSDDDGADSDG